MRICDRCNRQRTSWDSPCVCPAGTPEHIAPMDQAQVDKWGNLFARILDKRDGIGSQGAVDEAIDAVLTTRANPQVGDES